MRRALAVILLLLPAPVSASDWRATLFAGRAQPKSIHYRARVVDGSSEVHTMEAWREPERLRRSSDGVLDLYATRIGSALSVVLVDKRSGRVIRGDDRALLRAGHIEAWSELAYVLVRPAGEFELWRGGRPKRIAGAQCQPYRIRERYGATFGFCWSARLRLPLEVDSPDGRQTFVVDFVEERHAPDEVFLPPAPAVTDQTDDD